VITLTRIIHEYLLQRPILSPGVAFFSFGLLDGPSWITVSRTGRLTISAARTDVAHFIQRAVRPAGSPGGLRSQPLRNGIHQ
jgi:hypothetical protein